MKKTLEKKAKKKSDNQKAIEKFANSKSLDFCPGSEHLSEQIDEILYEKRDACRKE